jgi:hypothetical protein
MTVAEIVADRIEKQPEYAGRTEDALSLRSDVWGNDCRQKFSFSETASAAFSSLLSSLPATNRKHIPIRKKFEAAEIQTRMRALSRSRTRCLRSSTRWDLFFVQVAGFARQARPQSRPRHFWVHSETKVRPCCPHLNPLGSGGSESFARFALTRVPLVAPLGLELGILGEKPQPLEGQVDPPSAAPTATQTPGPAPLLKDIMLAPVFAV